MKKIKLLTFNAALQDVRLLGYSLYRPVDFVVQRLDYLSRALVNIDADIVFLQELFHRKLQLSLYSKIHKHYPYVTGLVKRDIRFRLDNELLILSKYPLARGNLVRFKNAAPEELRHTSKGFYHTSVYVPGLGNIQLVNFHTTAGGANAHPESHEMGKIRAEQINQILEYIRPMHNIILGGDLNSGPHSSTENYNQILDAELKDIVADAGLNDISWDRNNPLVANGVEHHLPNQLIDHLFIDNQLSKILMPQSAEIVFKEKCVKTSKEEIPLSDHYGVTATLRRN